MQFVPNDGGRAAAGYKGSTGDCVSCSIAIATGKPYHEVYDALNELGRIERIGKRQKRRSNSRTGVYRKSYQQYLESLGWRWTPTMAIGTGCTVHLRSEELPRGRLLIKVSGHLTAVIDGVLHDTHDCSRRGTRCVYGYFSMSEENLQKSHKEETMITIDSCSIEDVDRLLGLADQFLDDWAEDAVQGGKPDEDYQQRSREWAVIRPLLLFAPRMFQALQKIAGLDQETSGAMALRCTVLARTALDGLLDKEAT